jgi:DNA-binding transcriptional ArsR family regulator
LQILYGAGIVRRRREGSSVVYSLKSASLSSLCELVYQNETGRADIQSE